MRASRCFTVALAVAIATTSVAENEPAQDKPRRDEFGVVLEEPADPDLKIPDPWLDRTWPGPAPGPSDVPPPPVAPDEAETDPFDDGTDRPPAVPPAPKLVPPPVEPREKPAPAVPPVAPDGKRDFGSPAPEAEILLPDPLEPDRPALGDMENEELRPSPYDRGVEDDGAEDGSDDDAEPADDGGGDFGDDGGGY